MTVVPVRGTGCERGRSAKFFVSSGSVVIGFARDSIACASASGSFRAGASLLIGVALLIAACSRLGSTAGSSALKPIDQAALQTMVDTTAKELLIPGAVVLLRTPQGQFTVTYGTTLLGAVSPPRADTHFRIASNTKTMTAAVIVLLAQEGKLQFSDPVSKYIPNVPNGENITID